MQNLKEKNIIITGAASGIGKATTIKCLEKGARVFALDIDSEGLEKLNQELKSEKFFTNQVDVSRQDEIKQAFKSIIQKYDSPNVLVNNAGIYLGKSIFDYTESDIDKVISVNMKAAILFSQLFAKELLPVKKSGIIVNISSVSGQEGSSDAVYGMTKAALIGLTKSNAMNFAPYIRVNAIAPGVIKTPMMQIIPENRIEAYKQHELIKEFILPEDVAETILFLISDSAKHYSGAVFDLNNGCYMR